LSVQAERIDATRRRPRPLVRRRELRSGHAADGRPDEGEHPYTTCSSRYPTPRASRNAPSLSYDAPVHLEAGRVVAGRYRLDRRLGEGGMGTVWSATHTVTRRAVALKFLKDALAAPNLRARFLREARAATSVRHPNVVEIYDVFEEDDGLPVMVMELLVGQSLGEYLDGHGKVSATELARLILPAISAVGTAHALGIVHRDLKPDNIFLAQDGDRTVVKVLDFGIAKVAAASIGGNLTHTGTLMGTPQYMSPEQAFGESDLDHRADIFSLGIILYECLSGILPTRAANLGQILKLLTIGGIPPLRDAAPDVPPALLDLVERMMSRAREDRPADLGEVYDVIAPFARAEGPAPFGPPSLPLADFESGLPPPDPVTAPTEPAAVRGIQITPPGTPPRAAPSGTAATIASEADAKVPATTPAEPARREDSLDSTVAAPGLSVPRATAPATRRAWWLGAASVALVGAVAIVGFVRAGGGPSADTPGDAPPSTIEVAPPSAPPTVTPVGEAPAAPVTPPPSAAEPPATAAVPASARPRASAKVAATAPAPSAVPTATPAAPPATASSRTKGLVVQPPF
jgi:eukaryotic-like serine/threonine-protein kinase